MLRLEDLRKSFNGFVATNGVSLEVSAGERHAIIGPNGAGKSTLFNLITGHLRPDRGTVRYRGKTSPGLRRMPSCGRGSHAPSSTRMSTRD